LRDERVLRAEIERSGRKLGKVCTTISAKTGEEAGRKAVAAFALGTDIVEFRLDLLEEPPSGAAQKLRSFFRKAIVTVRKSEEGGGFRGNEGERLELIGGLAALRPLFLDIELSTVRENPEWYGRLPRSPRKIVSWHDFAGTPTLPVMRRARVEAGSLGDVAKIVTMAKKKEDNLRVLRLYEEDPVDLIAFCMGAAGSASRLASLQLGSPVVYASLPNEPVAPGQLSVSTLVGLKRLWEGRRR